MKYYPQKEIARVLNISSSTVQNWMDKGRLGFFRLPDGGRRVTDDHLRKFMEASDIPMGYLDKMNAKEGRPPHTKKRGAAPKKKKATQQDIADYLGIDRSTVNKVLSPSIKYKSSMKDLIIKTAKEMGYALNKLEARSLGKRIQKLTDAVDKLSKRKDVPKKDIQELIKEIHELKKIIK